MLLDSGDAVDADLVVDAAGRGTRLPVWLEQWGFGPPAGGHCRGWHRLRDPSGPHPRGLLEEKVVVAGASRAEPIGLGMLFYEDGNWGLTTFGIDRVEPPQNFAEMCDAADRILPDRFATGFARARPSARWLSTSTRPAGGAGTTRCTASRTASSRSAMRW